MTPLLTRMEPDQIGPTRRNPVDADTLAAAAAIVGDVRERGEPAVREHAERLGDIAPGEPLALRPDQLEPAAGELDPADHAALVAAAERIRRFAERQRDSITAFDMPTDGGRLRQLVAPVERAGCYAPGGRYPLPSSVLMTAVTARAAGVHTVWVASPKPSPATRTAAAIAGADGLLCVGGAQAIAALAYGCGFMPPADAVVGPGNRWVTAAKQIVAGTVAIDMLAGPSEVLIIADDTADPATLAADLLAQAEHDDDAAAILVTTSAELVERVETELAAQLDTLPTAETARRSLEAHGVAVVTGSMDDAITIADRLAPEHLEVITRDAAAVAARCTHYGAIFIGHGAAEAVGDYGIGPNHTLPTGGTPRSTGGLSVHTFLRIRTAIELDHAPKAIYEQTARLARIEGLEAHARSAELRL